MALYAIVQSRPTLDIFINKTNVYSIGRIYEACIFKTFIFKKQ